MTQADVVLVTKQIHYLKKVSLSMLQLYYGWFYNQGTLSVSFGVQKKVCLFPLIYLYLCWRYIKLQIFKVLRRQVSYFCCYSQIKVMIWKFGVPDQWLKMTANQNYKLLLDGCRWSHLMPRHDIINIQFTFCRYIQYSWRKIKSKINFSLSQ